MSVRTIDRDSPCTCGSMVARELRDGCLECPYCNTVEKTPWVIAHE